MPFRERVPKQRLPKVSFAGFFHRVAWSAAPWDPIVFRATHTAARARSRTPAAAAHNVSRFTVFDYFTNYGTSEAVTLILLFSWVSEC